MTTKLTTIERQAIQGILDSDYMDGMTGNDAVGHDVWTWSANPFPTLRTFSGAVASLVKKGFVSVYRAGKDSTICVTRAGMDAFETSPAGLPMDAAIEAEVMADIRASAEVMADLLPSDHGDEAIPSRRVARATRKGS
jgi:hypothetical protein